MPSPLRVLHVMPLMDPAYGGPVEAADRLCRALHGEGVEVQIVTTDRGFLAAGPHRVDPAASPFPIAQHPVARPASWSRSPALARSIAEVAAEVDLIHAHTIYHYSTTVAARVGRRTGTPVVIEPHGSLTRYSRRHKRAKKALYEQLLDFPAIRRAAGVRCASTAERDDLVALGLGQRAFVVPHGVDPAVVAPPHTTSGDRAGPIVLFLGRLAAKKRLDLTVDAFAVTHRLVPDARLRIVGNGETAIEAMLQRRIADHGLGDAVEVVGARFGDARLAELHRASAFVLLSDDESFGMAPLEALCAGVPVLATPMVSSMRDLADRTEVVLVPQDHEEAGRRLAEMLTDPATGARARQQSSQLAEDFAWSTVARRLTEEYRQILSQR